MPVCEVLDFDDKAPKPFMILKRLPGTDIGNVIGSMTASQTTDAARTVAAMQTTARELPPASGFGYAPSYESPLHTSWRSMLETEVEGARRSIVTAGVVDAAWVDNITYLLDEKAELLADVEPAAFLDDATTKNVIVDDGQVVGLVDVDHMAFGDPLWAVVLTRMSLLAAGHPTLYADAQIDLVSSSPLRHDRVELYTTLHCLNFLAELGQQFNQESAPPVDIGYQQHLETILALFGGA